MTLKVKNLIKDIGITPYKQAMTGLLVAIILSGCTLQNESPEHSEDVFKDEVVEELESLKVGICFDDASEENTIVDDKQNVAVTSIPIVPCHKPHDNEVYYIYELPDAKSYQETDELLESMFVTCEDKFESYVGKSYQASFYEMSFLTPTVDSWADGDREVVCYAFHPEADKLSQSLKTINK